MSIKDRACVSGIGETRYMRGSPSSVVELQLEASLLAAADAALERAAADAGGAETASALEAPAWSRFIRLAMQPRWVSCAPLGKPVVPEV